MVRLLFEASRKHLAGCINLRRTTVDQEVLALIAPLAKLGRFEEAADFFRSLCLTFRFSSGAIETIPPG